MQKVIDENFNDIQEILIDRQIITEKIFSLILCSMNSVYELRCRSLVCHLNSQCKDLTIMWGIWVNYPIIRNGCRSRLKVLKSVSYILLYVDIFYLCKT